MNFQEVRLHCQEVCKRDDGLIFIVPCLYPRQSHCIVHFYEAFSFMPPQRQSPSLDAMGQTRNKWGCGFSRVVSKAQKIIAGCVNFSAWCNLALARQNTDSFIDEFTQPRLLFLPSDEWRALHRHRLPARRAIRVPPCRRRPRQVSAQRRQPRGGKNDMYRINELLFNTRFAKVE